MARLPSISGNEDPEGEAPWAMQLVCRIERADPPDRSAACAAAAMAVVRLLDDDRSRLEGEWHDAVARWVSGRVRKHARRARGIDWERVAALAGVTVTVGGAQV